MESFQKDIIFHISTSWKSNMLSILERRALIKSLNKMLKIANMRSISIQTHEWILANIVPIPTTKHKMIFGDIKISKFWTPPGPNNIYVFCFLCLEFLPPNKLHLRAFLIHNFPNTFWNMLEDPLF